MFVPDFFFTKVMKTCEQGALSWEAEWAHAPHQQVAPLPDQWCMKLRPDSCITHIHLIEDEFICQFVNWLDDACHQHVCRRLGMFIKVNVQYIQYYFT